MAEVKWIKMDIDVFDNRKIRAIETLPERDTLIVIWFKLLCLAGNVNDDGMIYLTRDIPFTDQILSSYLGRPLATVQLALYEFSKLGMIEITDDIIRIANWEKHQNVDRMAEIREANRLAQQRHRAKLKENNDVTEMSCDSNMTCHACHATEEDIEEDIDIDIDKRDISNAKPKKHKYGSYQNVLLSDSDLEKWRSECPEADKYIESMSEYMSSTGKSYKNHLATLRSWYRKDKERNPKPRSQKKSYDIGKWEENQLCDISYERRRK